MLSCKLRGLSIQPAAVCFQRGFHMHSHVPNCTLLYSFVTPQHTCLCSCNQVCNAVEQLSFTCQLCRLVIGAYAASAWTITACMRDAPPRHAVPVGGRWLVHARHLHVGVLMHVMHRRRCWPSAAACLIARTWYGGSPGQMMTRQSSAGRGCPWLCRCCRCHR